MRLGLASLLIAMSGLAGCKGLASRPFLKKERDKEKEAAVVSRPKGAGPSWLADTRGPGRRGSDPAREGNSLLAGRVLDPSGRGARNVFIRIEPVDATAKEKEGAALGILTDDAGYFVVKTLPANRVYILTAETRDGDGGRALFGQVQTRPPQPNITISLRDDLRLPVGSNQPSGASTAALPLPSKDLIPPMGLPAPTKRAGPGGWSPGAGSTTGGIPATIPGSNLNPAPVGVPPPIGVSPPADARPGMRPESTASGEAPPWKPPTANIPSGPPIPSLPLPPPGPTFPEKSSSAPMRPGANFTLVDSLDRPWDFAANRTGSLVLLEFMTTNCVYCKKSIPILASLQSRYSPGGLQLIGVLCDNAPRKDRAVRAGRYQRDNHLNYAVYAEEGAVGSVRDRFQIEAYPTVVLLGADGSVLWKGHPGKKAELESAIRRNLHR